MKPRCEEVVKKLFPAIRAAVVRDLIERHKLTQSEAAKKLGITQPAVSQYMNQLRGNEYKKTLAKYGLTKHVKKITGDIAGGKVDDKSMLSMYCGLCSKIRKNMPSCV
jgi:hypothetical protein